MNKRMIYTLIAIALSFLSGWFSKTAQYEKQEKENQSPGWGIDLLDREPKVFYKIKDSSNIKL